MNELRPRAQRLLKFFELGGLSSTKQGLAERRPDKWPSVSVIVPFYGKNVKVLRACLLAIGAQDYPVERVEVIVVDNNQNPFLGSCLDDAFTACRIAHEPGAGSYRARNLGISLARGAILAFTDADCRPDGKWLRMGVECLLNEPDLGFVGGHVAVTHRSRRPNVIEAYDKLMHMRQEVYVREFGFGATANLFTYSSVIEAVGRFDIEFLSGGDREWGRRVVSRGYGREFAAKAIVFHPARTTLSGITKKVRRLVGQEVIRARRSGMSYRNIVAAEARGLIGQWFHVYRNRERLGPFMVASVVGLVALLRVIRALEWVRIVMGGKPQR